MIIACCDIGNSKIKTGLFEGDNLTEFISFSSPAETIDYLRAVNIDDIVISSVVPKNAAALLDYCRDERGTEAFVIDHHKQFRLQVEYKTPATLGIDRLCSAEGAFKLFSDLRSLNKNEVIVVIDLGTAATLNIIKYPGTFSGGLIAPGPGLLFKAMKLYTAQLPEVSYNDYIKLIGDDTNSSIASGVMNTIPGLIERVLKLLSAEYTIAEIYLTGGNASLLKDEFAFEYQHIPELLISGMKSVYDLNRNNH